VHGTDEEARAARKPALLLGRMALLRVNMDMMTRRDTVNTGNRRIIRYNYLVGKQAIKSIVSDSRFENNGSNNTVVLLCLVFLDTVSYYRECFYD
jgi:hypothetical protein